MTSEQKKKPKCIQCGRKEAVRIINDREYHCTACGTHFDNDPDEGGDYGKYPDQRMKWQEREKKKQRRKRY